MLRQRKPNVAEDAIETLKTLDFYPKVDPEIDKLHRIKTNFGGYISLISSIVIILLVISEFIAFCRVNRTEHMLVDTMSAQKLSINLDILFPSLPCFSVNLDVMDVTGDLIGDSVITSFTKQRIHPGGSPIGSRYSYTKESGRPVAIQLGEGCHVLADLLVNRVLGNFHFAIGVGHDHFGRHLHNFGMQDLQYFNTSHKIISLRFGNALPGVENPLDGATENILNQESGQYQYFVSIVPTKYQSVFGNIIEGNQYAVTKQFNPIIVSPGFTNRLPGIFFVYDISPFSCQIHDSKVTFLQFLVSLCAIVGGVFVVGGVLDSVVHHWKNIKQDKLEIKKSPTVEKTISNRNELNS